MKDNTITSIIAAIGATVISSAIIAFFRWIKPRLIDNRLIIREIKKKTDRDINSFIRLYNSLINNELKICAEQIVDFIDPDPSDNVKHHLYLCKHKDNVVGFIKFIISYEHDYLFIAYIAIDENDPLAVRDGVRLMISKLNNKYLTGKKQVSQMFTEIERGANNGYITSLYRNIARRTKEFNYRAYLIEFDYIQPNMPDDSYKETNEKILSLIWVPCDKKPTTSLSQKKVIEICKNLYKDIYWPSCSCSNDCNSYMNYLKSIYVRYETNLPAEILIKPM